MSEISAVLVHYHTPQLAADSVRALRRDADASNLALDITIVDNGSTDAGRRQLQELPADRLIASDRNLGYAGGVNRGLQEVEGRCAIVLNPDVNVQPGCLGTLLAELEAGTAAVAPRLYWDQERSYLLPPTERVDRWSALGAALATRGDRFARVARQRWRRHAWRHWHATEPLSSWDLSGAILGVRLDAWKQIGPFDDGFQLYFEETDWLTRLRRAQLPAKLVPTAAAVHLYAQSSRLEGRAKDWFEASARRFRERYYGKPTRLLLETLTSARQPENECAARLAAFTSYWSRARWLEMSESELGFPAAGRPLGGEETADSSLLSVAYQRAAEHGLRLTLVDARGKELVSGRPA